MKICSRCHSEFPDTMVFCSNCGTRLNSKSPTNQSSTPRHNNQGGKPNGLKKVLIGILVAAGLAYIIFNTFNNAASYLLLEPSEVSFPIKGGQAVTVDVNYDGHRFSLQHYPSWITVEKEDTRFTLTAEPNNTGDDRSAILVVKSGKIKQALPVVQKGKATYILVNPQSLRFGRDSEEIRVDIDCDGAGFVVDSHPEWVRVRKRDGYILAEADDNKTSSNREGYIVISSGDLVQYVPVKQGGGATYIRFEPESLTLPKGAYTLGDTWVVDIDFDGYDFDVTFSSNWLQVSPSDNQLYITADNNDTGQTRDGSVTIKSGDVSKTLKVRQNGKATKIEVDQSRLSDGRYGGKTYRVNVKTDGSAYTVKYPDGISIECQNDYFTVKFLSNSTGYYRSGSLVVTEDNISKSISIVQGGKCNVCHGTGKVDCSMCNGQGGWYSFNGWNQCYMCKGAGHFECSTCHGSGYREP